ncbi:hypothetical protein Calab_0703 [Caldithrix abyssi DSM 13497]|uniref:Uncharacterized protein n=1 Tax=Caldithrix abyssi DSM 13497 TaxID=880073 RepID=H1XTB0_CALAY|nr:hypothetical protein [Caldithrix abyssi]APF20295.1 hypothetical protein Cabys_3549 [Caldithrix abyssi DSM 13497]EHO40343.1 hypothetical protein Calab_0703 [Caldithrix abyssi DSM 13497]
MNKVKKNIFKTDLSNLKPSKTNKKSLAGIENLKPKPKTNPQGSKENENNLNNKND